MQTFVVFVWKTFGRLRKGVEVRLLSSDIGLVFRALRRFVWVEATGPGGEGVGFRTRELHFVYFTPIIIPLL